jgi:hypothetical protein
MKQKYPVSRKDNLVVQELDGEVLIYDVSENKAFCLNETSGLIWQACDGEKSVAEISKLVSQKLNSPANEDLIWFALDQLKKENLIENGANLPNHFAGMSRREVIKKIGLGTMIALPVVASMVAPVAVEAQSACNVGAACTCAISGMAAGGAGGACAPVGTGGCNMFPVGAPTCICRANSNGNGDFTGTCAAS